MGSFSTTQSTLFHKRGQNQSLWFRQKEFHSFAEWVTHLFQIEIAEAYAKKKAYKCNIYQFISQFTLEQIEVESKKAVVTVLSKNQKTQSVGTDLAVKEKSQQQKKYMFGKCWDRMQAEGRFVICQYSWLEEDRNGQFANIMDEMYVSVQMRFSNFLLEQQIKDIEKFQTDLNKTVNKKKKKKGKKKGGDFKQQKQDHDNQVEHQQVFELQKQTNTQSQKQTLDLINQNKKSKDQKGQELMLIQDKNQKQLSEVSITQQKSTKPSNINVQSNSKHSIQQVRDQKQPKIQQKFQLQNQTLHQKSEAYTESTCKIDTTSIQKPDKTESSKKVEDQSEKETQLQQQRHTTKTKQYEQYYANDKTSQISQQSELSADCVKLKQKSKSLSKHSIVGVSMKKIDRKIQQQNKKQKLSENIIGTALENYAKFLIEESDKFQNTRKAAVDLLRQFLIHQEIKCKWELMMFGSCQVGYALKQSDIDLVLRIQDPQAYSLKKMQQILKFFPWILECQYISTANVPIITLKINLYEAKKLSNRLLKKLDKCQSQGQNILQYAQDFIVTVDISLCRLKEQYGGVVSSNNLRFLFYENESLKKIVFILKDLLRRKQLNKTYRGGVNSYVLTMMIYGIIKKKQLQLTKNNKVQNEYVMKRKKQFLQGLKSNLYLAFCEISNYLKDFIPFETLINPLDQKLQYQEEIHLNIIDPFSKKLVKTSAFRIDDIINEIQSLRMFLDTIKDEIKGFDLQNKKTKFQVYEKIVHYMNALIPEEIDN